jgi:hypothetical protein
MIGKTIKGRGFRGLLDYLAGRAGAELVGGNMEGTNPRELAREFGFSRALRPGLGKAVCHIPLRLPYGERLSVAQWNRIAERVMAWMGFADCSYALYLHPQHPQGEHLHIVASRVSWLGDYVSDSRDMERLMQIERRIERDYGLREVPYRRLGERRPRRGEYQLQERTGEASERGELQRRVAGAARPGLPVAEFVAELERRGVELRPAVTATGRVTGVRYRCGEHTFSGSGLGADFSWPGLLGRLGLAFEPARDLPALVAAGRRFDARGVAAGNGTLATTTAAAAPAAPAAAAAVEAGWGAAVAEAPAAAGWRAAAEVAEPRGLADPRSLTGEEGRGAEGTASPAAADRRQEQQSAAEARRGGPGRRGPPRRGRDDRTAARGGRVPGAGEGSTLAVVAEGEVVGYPEAAPAGRDREISMAGDPAPPPDDFERVRSSGSPTAGGAARAGGRRERASRAEALPGEDGAAAVGRSRGGASPGGGDGGAGRAGTGPAAGDAERGAGEGAGGGRGARPETADQVARQLAALGSPRYDLLVLHPESGERRHERNGLTPSGVVADVPWLKHLNAGGCEILVRPSAPAGLSFFEGVRVETLRAAREGGLEPAAVLRAPDGAREVWMRGGADLPPAVQELVDGELARELRPSRGPLAHGYGHLAGFTSAHAQQAGGLARPPYLTLEEDGGRVYSRFRSLAPESRARASAQALEVRARREIAALGRGTAAAPVATTATAARGAAVTAAAVGAATEARTAGEEGGGARPGSPQAALHRLLAVTDEEAERRGLTSGARQPAPGETEQRLWAWARIQGEHAAALAAAAAAAAAAPPGGSGSGTALYEIEGRVVASFRAREEARYALAEWLGVREVPGELPEAAAVNLARWRGAVSDAEQRLDEVLLQAGAPAGERLEAAIAVRTLREELAEVAAQHGLEAREPVAGAAAALLPAAGDSIALGGMGTAEGTAAGATAAETAAAETTAAETTSPAGFEGQTVAGGAAAMGAEAGAAAATVEMDAPSDGALMGGYEMAAEALREDGGAAEWRRQLAAELSLDGREAALRQELRGLEWAQERAALQLEALETRIEGLPGAANGIAQEALADAIGELERRQVPLAERIAALADRRLERDLERLQQVLERRPSEALVSRFTQLLEERRRLAPRFGNASWYHVEFDPPAAPPKPQVGAARRRHDLAVQELMAHPSPRAVGAVAETFASLRQEEEAAARAMAGGELRAARQELRRAGDGLARAAAARPGESPGPAAAGPVRRALERYQAAESAVARRLDAAESARDTAAGAVDTLVARVLRGDLSADTLARLQRAVRRDLRAAGVAPGPLPAPAPAGSLGGAVTAYEAARAGLRQVIGRGEDAWQISDPRAWRELREAVGRYQAAAVELDRGVQAAARTPESRTLPLRYFLEHPGFAGQPHRAVAAWAAHVAQGGVEAKRIPEALAGSRRSRIAGPRTLSSGYGLFLAGAVARVGLSIGQHLAHDT